MSCGALVIGSKTKPVEEVIENNVNGLLVDFNNPVELSEKLKEVIQNRGRYKELKKKARETIIRKYELSICLRKQLQMIDWVQSDSTVV